MLVNSVLLVKCFVFFFRNTLAMSHFTLEATVDDVIKMDAPMERGPLLRWQRKAIEAGMRAVSIDGNFILYFYETL